MCTATDVCAIEIDKAVKRLSGIDILKGVNLRVPCGSIFGLIGPNGAGKTTLIRHLIGGLRPTSGRVAVLGKDPVEDRQEVLSQVGYLSENRDLPLWMHVNELFRYLRAFYPTWDSAHVERLSSRFRVDRKQLLRHCSQGQLAQVGLISALAYHPPMLILDEPSSGLDPIIRSEMFEVLVEEAKQRGTTILLSSHLLDEVNAICTHVAMLHQGNVVFAAPLSQVRSTYRMTRATVGNFSEELLKYPTLIAAGHEGINWYFLHTSVDGIMATELTSAGAKEINEYPASLSEIFLALARGNEL